MGSRPNQTQSIVESSKSRPAPSPASSQRSIFGRFSKKTILIPTLACLLFVYATTSIRAAKANAQRHRETDTGGEGLSLVNESRRRHGMDKKIQGSGNTITELASEARAQLLGEKKSNDGDQGTAQGGSGRSENEERLNALRGTKPRAREG